MSHAQQISRLPAAIGVTMRLLPQASTGDVHDALSQDWGRFLSAAGLAWIPLPSRGEETLALAKALGLKGFIFSGGGEAGKEPLRDATESLLLQHAQCRGLPVLGICRGFQAIQLHLGGQLCSVAEHVATRHSLWSPAPHACCLRPEVNSFHGLGIQKLAAPLQPLALSHESAETEHVEAAWASGLLGLMWHPEREALPNAKDVQLIRHFLAFPQNRPTLC